MQMKKSEQLFYLVKSLTKSEKRSFKLFAKINSTGEKSNYIILFDELDRMTQYDHQQLVKSIHRKTNTKNISQLKNQLNDVIMRSLLQYSSVSTQGMRIQSMINYITILILKGLTSQANDLIAKTKETAILHEDFIAIDRLAILEQVNTLCETDRSRIDTFLSESHPEIVAAREKNRLEGELDQLILRMRSFFLANVGMMGEDGNEQLEALVNHPILTSPPRNLSDDGQINFHAIWGHYYYLKGNGVKTYYHRKRVMDIFESTEGAYPPVLWILHARLLLTALSYFDMREQFNEELAQIKKALKDIPNDHKGAFVNYLLELTLQNIQLDSELFNGKFADAEKKTVKIADLMKKADPFLDSNLKMTLLSNFATAKIASGKYKEALGHLNTVLNSSEMSNIRITTQCYNKIKNIVIHYSLGNFTLIDSLISSTNRFFKKHDRMNDYVDSFLKFARRHLKDPYDSSKKQAFEKEAQTLASIATQLEKEARPLEYFNLSTWLDAISSGVTMEKLIDQQEI